MKIYCIKNPYTDKIVYIGKTNLELHVRLIAHCHEVYNRKRMFSTLKQKWFDNLIKNGILPKIELITECSLDEAANLEKYWIQLNNPILNVVFANNSKLLENISKHKSIPIYQYNKNGNFIKEWKSITEAATELNIENGNICYAANGKRKLAGEWMWSYRKLNSLPPYKKDIFKKEVHQYDKEGNYIASYSSGREIPNVKYKLISKCCNGGLQTVYGFRYSFIKYDKLEPLKEKRQKNQDIVRT